MRGGALLSSVAVLGGVWVGVAPFLVGFAPRHGWTPAVTTSVWIGAALVFVGLVGLVAFAAGSLGELARRRDAMIAAMGSNPPAPATEAPSKVESEEVGAKIEAVEDPDEALRTLVDRVLKDHSLAFDKPAR